MIIDKLAITKLHRLLKVLIHHSTDNHHQWIIEVEKVRPNHIFKKIKSRSIPATRLYIYIYIGHCLNNSRQFPQTCFSCRCLSQCDTSKESHDYTICSNSNNNQNQLSKH